MSELAPGNRARVVHLQHDVRFCQWHPLPVPVFVHSSSSRRLRMRAAQKTGHWISLNFGGAVARSFSVSATRTAKATIICVGLACPAVGKTELPATKSPFTP